MRTEARDCSAVTWPPADDPELQKIAEAYEREYELAAIDRELGLTEPESGRATLLAAQADLRSRGINPDDASEGEMLDALLRVSP
jgi:hypothetical protein